MPSSNNDDFLTQVQLTAVARLEADEYFSAEPRIPVISEVSQDIVQKIKMGNPCGMMVMVMLESFAANRGGGTLVVERVNLLVSVRETVAANRSSTGTQENGLRVAQKVALVLDAQIAAMSTDATPAHMGGTLTLDRIEAAPSGTDGVQEWHVQFSIAAGGICNFSRRGGAPQEGSP